MDRSFLRLYHYAFAIGITVGSIVRASQIPGAIVTVALTSLTLMYLNAGMPESAIPREDLPANRKVEHVVLEGLWIGALWSLGLAVVRWVITAIFL